MGLPSFLNFRKRRLEKKILQCYETLTVFPEESQDFGPCDCCGNVSRKVYGFVNQGEKTIAAYFIHWTLFRRDHGAHFDLILGKWGEGAEATDRVAVSLEYRCTDKGPEFMVIDAKDRPVAQSDLISRVLDRSEVIGHPIAETTFAVADAALLQDERVRELLPNPNHA